LVGKIERPAKHLVAGLGNPGRRYAATRHNIGFRVVDALASASGVRIHQTEMDIAWGRGRIAGCDVILAQPMAYMNCSGPPIRRLMEQAKIGREALLVIHDDIDLAFGRLKIKEKGGDGGHRGVRSLMDALGSGDFGRLRIGIGRPAGDIETVDYVLGEFDAEEARALGPLIDRASEAAITVLTDGIRAAMNRFNMLREP
jgi:PTH1 family peptidyl-tRNA hydrolase